MTESVGHLCQLLPWNFITKFGEGVVVQKDGSLQRTFAYRGPDIDSSGQREVEAISVRVADFAKRLGSGWGFHLEAQRFLISDYPAADFDSLAPWLIDRERGDYFRGSGSHFDSSYFLTFTWKPPSEGARKIASMLMQGGGQAAGDGGGIRQNVESFVNETNAVAALLSGSLLLAPLDNAQTVAYLHSCVSFSRHPMRFPHTQILLDRVIPDSELLTDLTMRLGDRYIPIVGVNDFPEATYPAILDGLNRARIEYRWVTRYICLDKEAGKEEARKKEKAHRGSRKTFLQTFAESTSGEASSAINHGAGVKEADSIDAGVEIETDKAALGFLTTCVIVNDRSWKKALKKADAVRAVVNGCGFTCKIEDYNALEAWLSSLPGVMGANHRAHPVMSYNLSHLVPLSSVWSGFRSNAHASHVTGEGAPLLACPTLEGTPFFLNLNVGDVGHTAVWGPTGAGKSTLLNLLEMQFLKYPGSLVVVFDKGRSCRQPCLAVGGRFYEPAGENASGVCFQPLRDLSSDRDVADAGDFIEACVSAGGGAVSPAMRTAIGEALNLMRGMPEPSRTLTSFVQYCNYLDPETRQPVIKELLGDYLIDRGKYGRVFDSRGDDLDMGSRFVAFEMEALMNRGEGCVVPALVYLFNLVEKKFDGRLSLLVLDEAWLFLRNRAFADKIAEWLKVLRKKNVYVVFATQDVADVASSPLRTTVLQQCLTKIYLADPSALTPAMFEVYRAFGLSDAEVSLIASAEMRRDYFYTSPAGRRLFQLGLGPLTLALIGAPDHALLDAAESRFEPGSALCLPILAAKHFDAGRLIAPDAPGQPPEPRAQRGGRGGMPPDAEPDAPETRAGGGPQGTGGAAAAGPPKTAMADLLDAVALLPDRKQKDGSGRAAASLSRRFAVSQTTVYQIRRILRDGGGDIIDGLRSGSLSVKAAYRRLPKIAGQIRAAEGTEAL